MSASESDRSLEEARLGLEQERLAIEKKRAEIENRFLNKHLATVITAIVSMTAVSVSLIQVYAVQSSKKREMEALALEQQREWRRRTAEFVNQHEADLFEGSSADRARIVNLMLVAFPPDITFELFSRLRDAALSTEELVTYSQAAQAAQAQMSEEPWIRPLPAEGPPLQLAAADTGAIDQPANGRSATPPPADADTASRGDTAADPGERQPEPMHAEASVEPRRPDRAADSKAYDVAPTVRNRSAAVRSVKEHYPALLKDAGIEGTVVVWLLIDAEGKVTRAEVQSSAGHEALDAAATAAAKLFEFTPALKDGKAVAAWIAVPITFAQR